MKISSGAQVPAIVAVNQSIKLAELRTAAWYRWESTIWNLADVWSREDLLEQLDKLVKIRRVDAGEHRLREWMRNLAKE